jgi:cytochrome c oxidase assembly factor CtaG
MRTLSLVALLLLIVPTAAFAHAGHEYGTAPAWTFDPWVIIPLLVSAGFYLVGVKNLWRRAGRARGIRPWQVICYGAGWLMLAGALVSPLHWLGERLFTFHMIEHEIVMAIAAPLIAVARPLGAFLWALPKAVRVALGRAAKGRAIHAVWQLLTTPLIATILHGVAIWAWHAPRLFDAAVTNVGMHRAQHLTFLVTALLFWWALTRRCDYGAAAVHLFATMLHTSALGAVMALAPRVLYTVQTAHAQQWGMTPLEDQQLAGIVMWIPAGTVYAGAALAFAALWIKQSAPGPSATFASRRG